MQQALQILAIRTSGAGFLEITESVADFLQESGIAGGVLTLFCQHTSAGLVITENASPAVPRDLLRWFAAAAPEGKGYEHADEGPDDMPAHIRTAITGNSLTIPVAGGRMMLGTWQGVFLVEHRRAPHKRRIVAQVIGA